MTKSEALTIAQTYLDHQTRIQAKLTGKGQWLEEWTIDAYLKQVHHPVWVVFAENLKKGPFIDGVNEYSIVISTKTKQVEDCRLI
ncbi:MAG: hypothetical protein ACWA41_06570 [Putridiphycobacter sp.]